jgi:hypothetical protein
VEMLELVIDAPIMDEPHIDLHAMLPVTVKELPYIDPILIKS